MVYGNYQILECMACSELRIPEGGALSLHAPGAFFNGSCSGEDCVMLTSASAPATGKYQSPPISGGRRRWLSSALVMHSCMTRCHAACLRADDTLVHYYASTCARMSHPHGKSYECGFM